MIPCPVTLAHHAQSPRNVAASALLSWAKRVICPSSRSNCRRKVAFSAACCSKRCRKASTSSESRCCSSACCRRFVLDCADNVRKAAYGGLSEPGGRRSGAWCLCRRLRWIALVGAYGRSSQPAPVQTASGSPMQPPSSDRNRNPASRCANLVRAATQTHGRVVGVSGRPHTCLSTEFWPAPQSEDSGTFLCASREFETRWQVLLS